MTFTRWLTRCDQALVAMEGRRAGDYPADLWREAFADGLKPTQAVAEVAGSPDADNLITELQQAARKGLPIFVEG